MLMESSSQRSRKRIRGGSSTTSTASTLSNKRKTRQLPKILCCECGVVIQANASNMCAQCLRSRVDIAEGLPTQLILFRCRMCGKFLGSDGLKWFDCDLESQALLTICLKRITGLRKKVRLVDAAFKWTEPHSKRVIVKITIQKEVFGAILQQVVAITYVIRNQPCDACAKAPTDKPWNSSVQVRQKVTHKRTMYLLEQIILKHNVHVKCSSIITVPGAGLDFNFSARSHARSFVAFLQTVVPCKYGTSRELVSHDTKSNVYDFRYTFMVEIIPVCTDDVVCLPKKVANSLGCISQLCLVYRVTNMLHVVDPTTLKTGNINALRFYKTPFASLLTKERLQSYTVVDVQALRGKEAADWEANLARDDITVTSRTSTMTCTASNRKNWGLSVVTVMPSEGENDELFTVRTHLGRILKEGDTVLGYDIDNAVFNDDDLNGFKGKLPNLVLVRKTYPKWRKSKYRRPWRLARLADGMATFEQDAKRRRNGGANDRRDFEHFMQEVEEDSLMRKRINLYKAKHLLKLKAKARSSKDPAAAAADDDACSCHAESDEESESESESVEDDFPKIDLGNLLDEMSLETAQKTASAKPASAAAAVPLADENQPLPTIEEDNISIPDDDPDL